MYMFLIFLSLDLILSLVAKNVTKLKHYIDKKTKFGFPCITF